MTIDLLCQIERACCMSQQEAHPCACRQYTAAQPAPTGAERVARARLPLALHQGAAHEAHTGEQ